MCQQAARIKALSGTQCGRNGGGGFLSSSRSEPAAGAIGVPSGRVSHGGRAGEQASERARPTWRQADSCCSRRRHSGAFPVAGRPM
ncbi:unnamed protein product [Ixodes persulcatus]